MRTAPVTEPRRRVRLYAIYAVAVLSGMAFFNTVDQNILSALAASIQAEFHLSDTQIGVLSSAFALAIAFGALPLGYWADRASRRMVVGLGVAVWSLATLVTGVAQNFPQMFAARSVVGIGESSYQPVAASLLGDYFSKAARGRAIAAVNAFGGLGLAAGVILGGVVALHYGWRAAFFIAGGPGLLLALLAFTIREPLRGAAEGSGPKLVVARDSGLRAFGRLLRIQSYSAAVLGSALGGFGISVFAFIPLYLHRSFGLNSAQAAALVGVPLLAGVVIGVPLTGSLIDWRSRRSHRAAAEFGLVGLLTSGLAAIVMFSARSVPLFAAGILVEVLANAAVVIAPQVILQNVVPPSLRASAASMNLTFARLFGWALGPLAVGIGSDLAHRDLGLSLLLLSPTAFFLGAAAVGVAVARMGSDAAAMEASWAARAIEPQPSAVAVAQGPEPAEAGSRA